MDINIKYTGERDDDGRLYSFSEIVNGDAPDGAYYAWGSRIYLRCGLDLVAVNKNGDWSALSVAFGQRKCFAFRYLGPVEIEITVKGVDPNG